VHGSFQGEPIGDRFVNGDMATWAEDNVPAMTKREIDGVVEFLLSQSRRNDIPPPDPELVKVGRKFFEDGSIDGSGNASACSDCHVMKIDGETLGWAEPGYAPTLTGYASEAWLRDFLLNPGAKQNYGEKNAMPSYKRRLSEQDLDILLGLMRHRWYEPEDERTAANHGESQQ